MTKYTCLILCLVAASISRVNAGEEEDKAAFREAIKPIIDDCSKEHGVSTDEIQSAKTAGSAEGIKPCFLGCLYKKAEIVSGISEELKPVKCLSDHAQCRVPKLEVLGRIYPKNKLKNVVGKMFSHTSIYIMINSPTANFNAKGEYDVDNALLKLKKFVPDEAKYAKYAEIGKKCASVNEKPVTDGEAGCERGALLTACFLENRAEILI